MRLSLKNVAALALGAGVVASSANAAIVNYDIRIAGQSGLAAKNKVVVAGEVVNLEIYAVLLGANSDANTGNDGVVSSSMRFTSTEGVTGLFGNINTPVKAGSFTLGGVGTARQYDANVVDDSEWGGVFPATTNSTYFNPAALAAVAGTAVGNDVEVLVGTIKWTAAPAVADGASTDIQAVPYVNSSNGNGAYSVTNNGVASSNQNQAANVGSGEAVHLTTAAVPEPTMLGGLGLAAVGLIARRRRA